MSRIIHKTGGPWYRCPLCGNYFTEREAEACRACPKAKKCSLVMCPTCRYEFPKVGE